MNTLFAFARVSHWVKNLVILSPLFLTSIELSQGLLYTVLSGFLVFSLMTSCIYMFNDIIDEQNDRKLASKQHKPIVQGKITKAQAIIILITLSILTCSLSTLLTTMQQQLLLGYVVINLLYTLSLKKVFLLDISLVASGFVLRYAFGVLLFETIFSPAFSVLVFIFVCLMVSSKRHKEIISSTNTTHTNPAISHLYTQNRTALLNKLFLTACFIAIITFSAIQLQAVSTTWLAVIIPAQTLLFSLGIFRYYYRFIGSNQEFHPLDIILSDKMMSRG